MIGVLVVALGLGLPAWAAADETDNFTCRQHALRDSLVELDALLTVTIREVVQRANSRVSRCDRSCLVGELQESIGANWHHPLTGIPHSRLARLVQTDPAIDRCDLEFRQSIYGTRPYDQPWLVFFNRRIIFLADSIRLAGRVVGIDKLNHFIREGLSHWRDVSHGRRIDDVMARELGRPGWPLSLNEHGLKGLGLTGVLSYADLAASYSGYRFWKHLLEIDGPGSFVGYDGTTQRFALRRAFTFVDYVNDAWDESINPSTFDSTLSRQVASRLRSLSLEVSTADCRPLTRLPQARLYVSPTCFGDRDAASVRPPR